MCFYVTADESGRGFLEGVNLLRKERPWPKIISSISLLTSLQPCRLPLSNIIPIPKGTLRFILAMANSIPSCR